MTLTACDDSEDTSSNGGAALPSDPNASGFLIEVTGSLDDSVSQDDGISEVTTDVGTLNLVLRRERDLVVGLNFAETTEFAVGTYDAASLVMGTGNVGASFSAVDSTGDRKTGLDPAGTIVFDEAGETLSGSFELTFNVLGEDGSVNVSGTFQNLPADP